MAYFIVEVPYDKCFELFFQDELGYPNFYRMTELLSQDEVYQNLVLIAPPVAKDPQILDVLAQKADKLGMKYHQFGHQLQTGFTFHPDGMARTQPEFKETLSQAVSDFFDSHNRLSAKPRR